MRQEAWTPPGSKCRFSPILLSMTTSTTRHGAVAASWTNNKGIDMPLMVSFRHLRSSSREPTVPSTFRTAFMLMSTKARDGPGCVQLHRSLMQCDSLAVSSTSASRC